MGATVLQAGQSEFPGVYIRAGYLAYAAGMAVAGVLTAGWGPVLLAAAGMGNPLELVAGIRIAGGVMLALAALAAPLGLHADTWLQSRALLWIGGGHAVFVLIAAVQPIAISGDPFVSIMIRVALGISVAFLFLWFWTTGRLNVGTANGKDRSLFGAGRLPSSHLRSEYEAGIRRVAQQEERNRIARDLHDSVKQQLFVVQTAAATAQTRFHTDPEGTGEALRRIRDSSREAVAEMEALLTQLRSEPVERNGFVEGLRNQCASLEHRTGARVHLSLGQLPESDDLAPTAYEALFRVAQEALHNAGKHARAKAVRVTASIIGREFVLEVIDDGAGFEPNAANEHSGSGIGNMRERTEEIGGTYEIWSQPGGGTRMRVVLDLQAVDLREHRRQAWYLGGNLVLCLAALATFRAAIPVAIVLLPVAMILGYHLRVLWLSRKRTAGAA